VLAGLGCARHRRQIYGLCERFGRLADSRAQLLPCFGSGSRGPRGARPRRAAVATATATTAVTFSAHRRRASTTAIAIVIGIAHPAMKENWKLHRNTAAAAAALTTTKSGKKKRGVLMAFFRIGVLIKSPKCSYGICHIHQITVFAVTFCTQQNPLRCLSTRADCPSFSCRFSHLPILNLSVYTDMLANRGGTVVCCRILLPLCFSSSRNISRCTGILGRVTLFRGKLYLSTAIACPRSQDDN